MAFQNQKLSVIGYANGFTLWHYFASEETSAVFADGFFNEVRDLMHSGDVIYITKAGSTYIRVIWLAGNVVMLNRPE